MVIIIIYLTKTHNQHLYMYMYKQNQERMHVCDCECSVRTIEQRGMVTRNNNIVYSFSCNSFDYILYKLAIHIIKHSKPDLWYVASHPPALHPIPFDMSLLATTPQFHQKFRIGWYSYSFLSKIKGFNIPVYIPLTTSKGNEHR